MSVAQQPTTTLFLGNLDPRLDREILFEVGIQAGPLTSVTIPIDQTSGKSKGFGFLDYETLESAMYAFHLFSGNLTLFGKEVRIAYSPRGRPA